jgi:hypothetical protein
MLTKIYIVLGSLLIAGYLGITLSGWEWGSEDRQVLPASVRQSPGGYRSFHFWHSGVHGGK